jgi:hypothetical protein
MAQWRIEPGDERIDWRGKILRLRAHASRLLDEPLTLKVLDCEDNIIWACQLIPGEQPELFDAPVLRLPLTAIIEGANGDTVIDILTADDPPTLN